MNTLRDLFRIGLIVLAISAFLIPFVNGYGKMSPCHDKRIASLIKRLESTP